MKFNITNPIYRELKKLKLISDRNLIKISSKTRDKKISVIQDKKSKIIFLEKYVTDTNYYLAVKYLDDDRKIIQKAKRKITNIKTSQGFIESLVLEDDKRRIQQFKNLTKNKDVLDFGCGWGDFLSNSIQAKSLSGVELGEERLTYIKNKRKNINIQNNINNFQSKFDLVSMFHVLEHIPNQIETLKALRNKIKKNGKIIIEVPHAEDFLLQFNELKEFKDFTFWSEHLILHTFSSLKIVLQKAGFKKININYFQRYGFANHLGWFIKRKPGGHDYFKNYNSNNLNFNYIENLVKQKKTDTLIAIASY